MNLKKYLFRVLILLFLNGAGLALGMDAPLPELKPIDKVFLNACKKNTSIEFALNNKANIKSVDPENGYTGLHYACMNGNFDRVKWFLKQDWNLLNVLANDGSSAINVAVQYNHAPIGQYLIDRQFIYLCAHCDSDSFFPAAKTLLKREANINAKADDTVEPVEEFKDFTPLLYACMYGQVEKVKFLLDHGADINQKSAIGLFPLYLIFSSRAGGNNESQRFEITKLLLAHGADLGLTGPQHHGIFAAAVRSNSIRCIKLLLDKGIDVNVVDEVGQNALFYAVVNNLPDLIPLLFNVGVKPVFDKEGASLVHIAVLINSAPVLTKLIERGLSVNFIDKDGQTPLHYAAEKAGVEVIKTLLNAGAMINSVDNAGKTPVMLAKSNPHKGVFAYLQKESRKPISAQKNVQAIEQLAPTKKVAKETVEQETKTPKKKKQSKKKKKNKELPTPVRSDETHDEEDLFARLEQESIAQVAEYQQRLRDIQEDRARIEAQERVRQSEIAPLETAPAPIEQLTEQAQVPQLSRIKKPKKTLIERAQEKVINTFITPETKKTFADVAAAKLDKKAPKQKGETITYGNLQVALPMGQRRLMLTGHQENPLAQIREYTEHVDEKRNDPNDYFHNFPTDVEKQLGSLAKAKQLQQETKQQPAITEYTIPATISFVGGKNIFPGEFEFMVETKEGQAPTMSHRVFIPNKKMSKKKKQLTLPAPTSGKGGTELPK